MARPSTNPEVRGRRHGVPVLLVGAALILLAWLAPFRSPPLYDGLEAPEEPYRYLSAAPALPSTGPGGAHQTLPVAGSSELKSAVSTGEMPPQAQLFLSPRAFVLPSGAAAVDVDVTPIPPPAADPHGRIVGNVYRVAVTAEHRPVSLRPGEQMAVVLRSPAGFGAPMVDLFDAGRWTELRTVAVGAVAPDLYGASMPAPGDVALVLTAPAEAGGHGPLIVAAASLVLALALATGITLGARGRRSRHER